MGRLGASRSLKSVENIRQFLLHDNSSEAAAYAIYHLRFDIKVICIAC